ncbi:uncharacterized protein Z518_07540 [Rhinocladiella mackenziei CBS 650.93]|uniref:Heterokaryon incompatibility domain-containing protein n=1 Tax=Rhinocladiella mackenziei CBS 650.93 TaxID=1442369 RepID=A0A0D2FPC3_9EURO|nr:uncharacterized protein Z518_07540 [Rhinocladiella mackenziei CBS 650.93]KIX03987.1 hypothetical protein Z518_07540 [Rhinocladiella mackenziei CBS 650.93]
MWSLLSTATASTASTPPESVKSGDEPHRPLDLLEQVLAPSNEKPSTRIEQARHCAEDLGLGRPGFYRGFTWDVSAHTFNDLAPNKVPLPPKYEHSGNFKWVGQEQDAIPQYLWDSETFQTVHADHEQLRRYCAVSWTWGRYQRKDLSGNKIWRYSTGTKWRVPAFEKVESPFGGRITKIDRLTHLKHLLRCIKAFRYFWIDVLCINQNADKVAKAEKEAEIAKQAQIFRNATASMAYLWTLNERKDHDLSRALGAFGGLLASCIYFRPGQPIVDGRNVPRFGVMPPYAEWNDSFSRLREDNWFTSLWALQEVVLFPSAIWITQDGGFVTINDRPVTTRLFASAVRLLLLMSRFRKDQWLKEERQYIQQRNMAPSEFFKRRKEIANIEHRRRSALQEARAEQQTNQGEGNLCIEVSYPPRIPSVLKHRLADRLLQDEIDNWVSWSFGKAGIDIALGATRTAILIAGSNRKAVENQPKEYALLAALKISYHPDLIPEDLLNVEQQYFSHNLLNVILRHEGASMFDVVHQPSALQFKFPSDGLLDDSEWTLVDRTLDYLQIELPGNSEDRRRPSHEHLDPGWTKVTQVHENLQTEVKYRYKDHERYVHIPQQGDVLTDMSTWSAWYPNPDGFGTHSSEEMVWEDVKKWHMHPYGMVHIPPSARIQDIPKTQSGTEITVRLNGGDIEYDIERLADLKLISQTQTWLKEKLGQPKYIFLPLYTRFFKSWGVSPRVAGFRGPYHTVETDETTGIVLVGKSTLQKGHSLTHWHKLGTYRGRGMFTKLGWRDGILVTSPHGDSRTPSINMADCQAVTSLNAVITQALSDTAEPVEGGFETVQPSDVLGFRDFGESPDVS